MFSSYPTLDEYCFYLLQLQVICTNLNCCWIFKRLTTANNLFHFSIIWFEELLHINHALMFCPCDICIVRHSDRVCGSIYTGFCATSVNCIQQRSTSSAGSRHFSGGGGQVEFCYPSNFQESLEVWNTPKVTGGASHFFKFRTSGVSK